ncbi:MAG: hypothetical protein L0215_16300 [Gemmataceae bacterium]|nr:hypothetical protein [Gemmataceae bacterium]
MDDWIKVVFLLVLVAAGLVKHFADRKEEKTRRQQERPAPPPPPPDADREGAPQFPEERIEHAEMTYEEVRRPTQRKAPPKTRPKPPPSPPDVVPRPKADIAEALSRLGTKGKKQAQATLPPVASQGRGVGSEATLPKSALALPPETSSRISEFEKRLEKAASALSPLPTAANSPVLSSVARPPVPQAVQKLHQLLRDRSNLRVAFLLREIFEPPLAKRHRRT